jgi:hypothetical protein
MVLLRTPYQASTWGLSCACLPLPSAWVMDRGGQPSCPSHQATYCTSDPRLFEPEARAGSPRPSIKPEP